MLILEGPDGSGKTTLLEVLQEKFRLPQHERFCTSDGPFDDLARLAFKDVQTMITQPLSIYDRHPLLSEYAYASAIPERIVRGEFLEGWAVSVLQQFARESLVILCLPPFKEVLKNVTQCHNCQHADHTEKRCSAFWDLETQPKQCECEHYEPPHHMVGVATNIGPIYQMYQLLHVFWPERNNILIYDYTDPRSIMRVFSRCQLHISSWNRTH